MKKHAFIFIAAACLFTLYPCVTQSVEKAEAPYSYDFDSGPKPDWRPLKGEWTMLSGAYTVNEIKDDTFYATLLNRPVWPDFIMAVDIAPGHTGGTPCEALIFPRMSGPGEGICFWMESKYGAFYRMGWRTLKGGHWSDPREVVKQRTDIGKKVRLRIDVKADVYTAYLDGRKISQVYDPSFPSSGLIGLGQWYEHWYMEDLKISFDNVIAGPYGDMMISLLKKPGEGEGRGEEPSPDLKNANVDARKVEGAAGRSERAADRAESAAKSARSSADRAEALSKKYDEIYNRIMSK